MTSATRARSSCVDRPVPGVAVVTLNRPERMNAMAFDVMVPVRDRLVELGHDNSVRAIVLTGAGGAFSSGADQKSAGRPPHADGLPRPAYALRSLEVLEDVVATLRRLHQPVIAAVNGAAVGGGLCLTLACDVRIASPDGVLPSRRHQQRAHRQRARPELSAAAGRGLQPRRRPHVHRP